MRDVTLVENYDGVIEFRDKLAKQLEIQLRTLLAHSDIVDDDVDTSPRTDIVLQFADPETGEAIGNELTLNSTNLKVSDYTSIPDYEPKKGEPRSKEKSEIFELILESRGRDKDYYRDKINNLIEKSKRKQIRFWLKNTGTVGARDVYLEIKLKSSNSPITIHTGRTIETSEGVYFTVGDEGKNAKRISETIWTTDIEMRALQPKREVSPEKKIMVSAEKNCSINVETNIYADTLSEPITRVLKINFNVKTVETSYSDLLEELEEQK